MAATATQRSSSICAVVVVLCGLFLSTQFGGSEALPGELHPSVLGRRWREEAKVVEPLLRQRNNNPPGCPEHPRPLPQEMINRYSIPEPLRSALQQAEQQLVTIMQNDSIQALSVGVVYDQELIWDRAFGLVDPTDPTSKVTSDTPFRVGSLTKALTTLMLYQLRDAKKVVLDNPVQDTVPEFKVRTKYKNSEGITWRSLASQNSGLQGSIPCNYLVVTEPILNDACEISNEEAWKRLSVQDTIGPMYSKPHYSDSGYAVIGRALEYVLKGTNTPTYEEYMINNIFKPLGMRNSFFELTWDRAKQVPAGYAGNGSVPSFASHADLNWARPTGQLYTTVKDLQKFMSLFFQGDDSDPTNPIGVLSSSLREMLSPVSINDDGYSAYGTPWEIYYLPRMDESYPSYWAITKTGAMPGFTASMFMFPEIKTGFIVQMNNNFVFPAIVSMLSSVLPAVEATLKQHALVPPLPPNATKYEGVYLASQLLGLLSLNITIKVIPEEGMLRLWVARAGSDGAPPAGTQELDAIWVPGGGNTFRVRYREDQITTYPCLSTQTGWNDIFLYFQVDSWTGAIYSLTAPGIDPYYGWTFIKQGWWFR